MKRTEVFSMDLAKRILKRTDFKISELEKVIENNKKLMKNFENCNENLKDPKFAGMAIGDIAARKELVKLFEIKNSILNIIVRKSIDAETKAVVESTAEKLMQSHILMLDTQYNIENTEEVYKN